MKKKIRIKFPDGRLEGPMTLDLLESHLAGIEVPAGVLAQFFPAGDWLDLDHLLNELRPAPAEKPQEEFKHQEFEYTIGTSETPRPPVEPEQKEEPQVEATKVIDLRSFLEDEIDVTKEIILPGYEKEEIAEEEAEPVEVFEKVDLEMATGQFNVAEILKDIDGEADRSLLNMERELEAQEKEDEEEVEIVEEKPVEEKKKVKAPAKKITKKIIIRAVAASFIAIYFLLELLEPGPSTPEGIKVVPLKIRFPVTFEFSDEKKSKKALEKGLKLYQKSNYMERLAAAKQFLLSLQHHFQNNPALGNLILTYSELLLNSKNPRKEGQTLFRLILIAKSKGLTDINVVMGTALFYFYNKKYFTALNVVENYLRVGKPSLKLLSIYLEILVKTGELTKAKKVYDKIKGIEYRPIESYSSIARFLDSDEQFTLGKKEVVKGLNNFKNSVPLYLEYCRYLIRDSQFKELEKILLRINNLEAEQSPFYYSKYLEYLGTLAAVKKEDEKAVKYFRMALKLHDSDELRSKLAALNMGGDSAVGSLVIESKIKQNMKLAREAMKRKNWVDAFNYAIEASDLNEKYIPAQILLAEVQVNRGFYQAALDTLVKLRREYPTNMTVNRALIMANINSYRLDAARKEIVALANTPMAKTPEYYSLLARYYLASDNIVLALKNLVQALNLDPLNDENFFLLGSQYLKYRKYQRAQEFLARAIDLDPRNTEYRALWAKILYELDSAETAIGYLRDVLELDKDNPKVLGDIAIYYYKSGQQQNFEEIKEKIERSPRKDEGLYQFLVDAAKLEDRVDDVIKYTIELIKLNPGDLKARMTLGEYLLKMRKWKDAARVFEEVKSSLGSFPRVNYYLSKVYTILKQPEKAEEAAKLEIKENPNRAYGYFALGEVYKNKKDWSNAVRQFEKAISLDPSFTEALMGLGWIKQRQNYFTEAQELYARALKEDSSLAPLHREMGFLYKSMGQSGLAIESFETYLKLDPTAKDAPRMKQWIKQLRL
ncbi:MAG: tetratricopeptide repeat protein [Deltaproteobacteria bacterium]|nr:MAG: tetratricopeptide repeat protein [Deltaproteobacteria bacterium]